jgi:hypothetical protein
MQLIGVTAIEDRLQVLVVRVLRVLRALGVLGVLDSASNPGWLA